MPKAQPAAPQQVVINLPTPYPWQKQTLQDLKTHRFVLIFSGRQVGKTEIAVFIAMDTAMQGGTVWWIAPSNRLANAGYDKLRKWSQVEPFKQFVSENRQRRLFTFKNGAQTGTIEVISADDPATVVGGTNDLVVIDEAARMHPDAWYEGAYSTLTVRRGKALMITNPRGKNWFWELWRKGNPENAEYDPDYCARTYSQFDNPDLDPVQIEAQKSQMPYKQYEREVLGLCNDEGGEVFFGVRQAATISEHLPPLGIYNPDHAYVAGMDISAGRQDYSVIIVFDVTAMAQVAMYRFSEPQLSEQTKLLAQVNAYWHPELIEVEENAQGMFAVPEFAAIGLPVRAWNNNWKTKGDLIQNHSAAIELGRERLLNNAEVIKEHEAMESDVAPGGTVRYFAPHGGFDDIVIASALAWRAATVRDDAGQQSGLHIYQHSGLYASRADTSETPTVQRRAYPAWSRAKRPAAHNG